MYLTIRLPWNRLYNTLGCIQLELQLILLISHPLCLLADFIVTGIPFCCGEFSGLDLHFGSFWRAIFGPRIFWVLLKTLGILGGLDFCLSFDHPGCLQYTPLGLYQTLYVVFHSIVEKLEPMWKSLIVLYFFNPLLCVWIFNNNVASRVCYNNMKLVLKFSFSLQCFVAFLYQWRHCFWSIMPHPPH